VLGLAPEDLAIALSIHGGKEQWVRLQWLCDLDALTRAEPGMNWREVLERARMVGCHRMVLLGFSLARMLLGTTLDPTLSAGIAEDPIARSLTLQCARSLVADMPAPSIYTLSRLRLDMRERLSDKLSYVVRTLATPRDTHFQMVKLPACLFFLYSPIKLGHDYVLLPLWLAFKWMRRRLGGP
jgi:hypothetical protein